MGKITLPKGIHLLIIVFIGSSLFTNSFASNNRDAITITGSISELNCNSVNNAAITISISGGTSPYTYLWSDSIISSNRTNLSAGVYTLEVIDALAAIATKTFIIKNPTPITMNPATKTDISCFSGSDGTITAGSVSGGNNIYEYSINGTSFQISNTFQNLGAGNYTITVKDSNGCMTSNSASLTQPNQLTMQASSFLAVSCSGGNDGSITAGNSAGGNGGYEYSIDGINFKSTRTFNNLIAGNYTITVRDANGCNLSANISVSEPSALIMNAATTTPVSCAGASDGSITAGMSSGGNSEYEYSIDGINFQASNTFSGVAAGDYILTVKDAKACTEQKSISVTEPAILTMANPTFTTLTCNGASDGTITAGAVAGGNSGYQYSIDGITFQTSTIFSELAAGLYNLSVKDAKGCIAQKSITVTEPAILTMANPTFTALTCNGARDGIITAGAVAGGNSEYQYSIDGITFQTSNTFSELAAGTYAITVKDAKGCSEQKSITVTEPTILTMPASTYTNVSCNGANDGTITAGVVAGGNGGYQYSIDGITYQVTNTFSNLTNGNYTLTSRDSKNCVISENIIIEQPISLTMEPAEITNVSCYDSGDGKIIAGTVTGGNNEYEYSIDGLNFTSSNTFNELNVGSHTITVRDSKGCAATETVTLTGPQILEMEPATSTNISCHGASDASVTAGAVRGGTTGYQYSIDGINFGSETTFNILYAGTYTLMVRDLNGCLIEEVIEITEPDPLTSTPPSSTESSCVGNNDGSITAGTVSGGNGGYLYSIDNINFNTTGFFANVSQGNYTIFIKDSIGCATQSDIVVTSPNELAATITSTNINCFEGTDGTIKINNPTGGHGTFEYSINGSTWQSNPNFTSLVTGSYNISIRDAAFPTCVVVLNSDLVLEQPTNPISVEVNTTRTTTYGTSTGSAIANASGGTPGFTYAWRKANTTEVLQTTKTANNLAAGNYEVTVTDKNGCSKTKLFTIIDGIKAPIIPTSICPEDADVIRTSYFEVEDLTAIGGVGPYTYEWNFGAGASPATATGAGSHTVNYTSTGNRTINLMVTDATGASKTESIIQYVGECFKDDCGSNDFAINTFYVADSNGNRVTASTCGNGQPKYLYFDLPTNSDRYSMYIEYIFSIEHVDGTFTHVNKGLCFYERQTIPLKVQTIELDWNCGDLLTVQNVYMTFSNNIKWKCGQGPSPKCYSTNNNEIVITPLYAIATPNELLCYNSNLGSISIKANGGIAPYQYSISGPDNGFQTSNTFNGLVAGVYASWVKDSEGTVFQAENVTINQPLAPISLTVSITNPICFGETGEATVTASGGTPFSNSTGDPYYSYLWNDALEQTTKTATNLVGGEYTVTVIDANGCQIIENVSIVEPTKITVAIAGEDQNLSCGFSATNLNANTPEVGTGNWSIISGTGGQILEPNNSQSYFTGIAGSYTLRWTISNTDNTCLNTDDVLISFSDDCSTLDFDGIDDHITMGDTYNLSSGNFTIEAWVKLNSTNGQRTIVSKRDSQNISAGGYDLSINSGSPTFKWGNSTVTSSFKLGTQRWYHVAVIFTNSQAKLYVDGIKVGNGDAANPTATNSPFIIGGIFRGNKPENPVNYFHGWIEEVRIWKTALQEEQLRFIMNQRLEVNVTPVKGTVLPLKVPGDLAYSELLGYYQLIGNELVNGFTPDKASLKADGQLKNIETTQENSAPLPYISKAIGPWRDKSTWKRPDVWDAPNSLGINGEPINWNIAKTSHDINSGGKDIYMLGLLSQYGELKVANPSQALDEKNTGQGITITHYLDLNGSINLIGESQLVQTEGSILEPTSSGFVKRDQQGTASSYNYNYWSSPVVKQGTISTSYTISEVMLDGTISSAPKNILFGNGVTFADGAYSTPRKISNYWVWKFHGIADEYDEWQHIGGNGTLKIGEGYTMKGTSGNAAIADRQNYSYKGRPNNGTIKLNIGKDQNYLIGNPYPSSMDSKKFILDNIKESGGNNTNNIFTGAIYYWDHFGGKTHILSKYVGGYATYNLIGGVKAIATDDRINSNTNAVANKTPGQFIPVGQGFFINSMPDPALNGNMVVNGGDVIFKNSQRAFVRESVGSSQFLSQETNPTTSKDAETSARIRIKFRSPKGYHRELLVGTNPNATNGFDLGYDAPLNEFNEEDMFWLIKDHEFVIQGVSNFDADQVLPIGVAIDQEGPIKIALESMENLAEEKMVYLHDKLKDTIHNLKEEAYLTNIEPGYIVDRFALVFDKEESTQIIPDIIEVIPDTLQVQNDFNITLRHNYRDNEIQILNSDEIEIKHLYLFNMDGKLLEEFNEISNSKEIRIRVKNYPSGVYIVKLEGENSRITKKIIIKNL